MEDPTRIPRLLDALRDVWEGQPDLSLAALGGIIQNQGVAWGTSDEELLAVLKKMAAAYPPKISDDTLTPDVVITFHTQSPQRHVTLDGGTRRVTVHDQAGTLTPTTWVLNKIVRATTSTPLVLEDTNEIAQRFGVIERIHVVARPRCELSGMRSADVGEEVYGVVGKQGSTVFLGRRALIIDAGRREISRREVGYQQVEEAEPGKPLVLRDGAGHLLELEEVAEVFVAIAPAAGE